MQHEVLFFSPHFIDDTLNTRAECVRDSLICRKYVSGQNICIEVYGNSVGTITPTAAGVSTDSGYPHDGRAGKNPYPHDRRADKDSYPHDSNNQCIILRLQLSFMMINEQLMLV